MKNFLRQVKDLLSPEKAFRHPKQLPGKTPTAIDFSNPRKVAIEASTACQLKCLTCPTSRGMIRDHLGTGFLSPENLNEFLIKHPLITHIELSNWGEAFLNPRLLEIFRILYENNVTITLLNGVNLNSASDEVLEALVNYKVRTMTCSIDGASQETYSIYRVNGNFGKIIENIRKINLYKEKYRSEYPRLKWQFVAFGHNEHEIGKARDMAAELNMSFKMKLSWEDVFYENFSPVKDKVLIRFLSPSGTADRKEYEEKFGKHYVNSCCLQMWLRPRINFDGRVLGCCINFWEDFGNAFDQGLEACLKSEKMQATRDLLMGQVSARTDIPCFRCKVYESRVRLRRFVTAEELFQEGKAV